MVKGLCRRLGELAEALPVPADQDAMFDDRIPLDVASFMSSAIDGTVQDCLEPAAELIRRAATVTAEELRQEFETRHAEYRRSQTRSGEPHPDGEGTVRAGHPRKET